MGLGFSQEWRHHSGKPTSNNALCKLDLGMWTCSQKRFSGYIKCATRVTICKGWKWKAWWKGGSEWLVGSIAYTSWLCWQVERCWKVGWEISLSATTTAIIAVVSATLWYVCRVHQHSKMWLNSRHFVWEGSQHGQNKQQESPAVHPSTSYEQWPRVLVICCR